MVLGRGGEHRPQGDLMSPNKSPVRGESQPPSQQGHDNGSRHGNKASEAAATREFCENEWMGMVHTVNSLLSRNRNSQCPLFCHKGRSPNHSIILVHTLGQVWEAKRRKRSQPGSDLQTPRVSLCLNKPHSHRAWQLGATLESVSNHPIYRAENRGPESRNHLLETWVGQGPWRALQRLCLLFERVWRALGRTITIDFSAVTNTFSP